jgi:hypothetical protein
VARKPKVRKAKAPARRGRAASFRAISGGLCELHLGGRVVLDLLVTLDGELMTFVRVDGELLAELPVAGEA